MPRKFSNCSDEKDLKRKLCETEKAFFKKIKRISLEDRKNSVFPKFLKKNPYSKCTYERALRCLNSNCNWDKKYKMAVEFDHMYLQCADSRSENSDIVIKELKEINLMHLELIQQQAEQLSSKEKIIKVLKEENKNLRARFDRIERRLSLNIHKKVNEVTPISVQTEFASESTCLLSIKSELSPKANEQKYVGKQFLQITDNGSSPKGLLQEECHISPGQNKGVKRENLRRTPLLRTSQNQSSQSPASPPLRISPRERKHKKDSPQPDNIECNATISNCAATSDIKLDTLCISPVIREQLSPGNKRVLIDEIFTPLKKPKSSLSPCLDIKEDGLTDHNLRSREKAKDLGTSDSEQTEPIILQTILPPEVPAVIEEVISIPLPPSPEIKKGREKHIVESRKVRSDGILTTDKPYFLTSPRPVRDLPPTVNENDITETQVEIPRWRVKHLTSLYIMEGTENLEDEIFIKRHGKLEQDERRRKRWDLQRMREQRQYEKLRERYEVRNNLHDTNSGYHVSLWPSPEWTHFLEIENSLPVCAFGQPLAQITESEFSVPWVPDVAGISSRRRKR